MNDNLTMPDAKASAVLSKSRETVNSETIVESVRAVHLAILDNVDVIEVLDREIGDGDHLINVKRGCETLVAMSDELRPLPPAEACVRIGKQLLGTIGGASGPLIASFFMSMGKSLGGVVKPTAADYARAFSAGVDAIRARGKADVGEKTMLDVLIPVARLYVRLTAEATPLDALCDLLKEEAERGMLATRDMVATKGRAYFLGERAIGHIDPGSKTSQVAISAVCDLVMRRS
jgi:phosphoenolpyruvate---glycerone phosphotransferase subunit DhaL